MPAAELPLSLRTTAVAYLVKSTLLSLPLANALIKAVGLSHEHKLQEQHRSGWRLPGNLRAGERLMDLICIVRLALYSPLPHLLPVHDSVSK